MFNPMDKQIKALRPRQAVGRERQATRQKAFSMGIARYAFLTRQARATPPIQAPPLCGDFHFFDTRTP